jgi:membrane-associated phospholipid phosphatase
MYNKNANVFAAIPSLHAAYPIILFYFGLKKKYKIASIIFFIDILGIWFAAVYSLHHYIIDLILGGICAIFAIFAFGIIEKTRIFRRLLHQYLQFSD